MRLVTALMVAGYVLLASCSQETAFNSGVVVSKNHQAEKRWVQIIFIPQIIHVGKMTMIHQTPTPIFHRRPEHWILVIQRTVELDGERQQEQQKLYVTRETYEKVSVGDTYTVQVTDKVELPIEKHVASDEEKLVYGVEPADPS